MSSNDSNTQHAIGAHSAFRMGPQTMAADPPSSNPTFQSVRIGELSKPAFGALGPLPKFGKAPMSSSSSSSKPSLATSAAAPDSLANTKEHSPKFCWVVTVLPPVPEFYPLDRTVLKLEEVSLSVLCTRISDFMREKSIKFADEPSSEACIGCLTPGRLKFVVQLWKGDEQSGTSQDEEPQTIIIEVQRRRGCAIEMKGIRNCLYHAIENGGDGSAAKRPSCSPRPLPPNFLNKMSKTEPTPSSSSAGHLGEATSSNSLKRLTSLLTSDKLDLQVLALEGLVKSADPTKVSEDDARRVAQAVLFGDEGDQTIRDAIEGILETQIDSDGPVLNDSTADSVYALALEVLSIALQTHLDQGDAAPQIDLSDDFWRVAVDACVNNLSLASVRPTEASLSAKSIRLLQTIEPSIMTIAAQGDDLQSLLLAAYQYGKSKHSSLELESGRLMGRVSITC